MTHRHTLTLYCQDIYDAQTPEVRTLMDAALDALEHPNDGTMNGLDMQRSGIVRAIDWMVRHNKP